ncbi:PREDICTED: calmodulin-like [Amphimedon queenslandica]|uniref:EF-hand domain-containing protein n=1 Tax=Amphimedon queenslandica TaxID=400682 RepID=A0A1X7V9V5_AMPQE|nr:PREDICTED: calmodulin-like [Amphimedon queenslandica]|eukprot:XP_011402677.1 PREDICTED: calmodulin-like [Amphimedon queenslandica]
MNLLCCFEDTTVDSMSSQQQSSAKKPELPEGALEICRKFDKDGNGYLSKSEIKEAVGNSLTKKELDDLMERADSNHDGKVDYEEFFKTAFAK